MSDYLNKISIILITCAEITEGKQLARHLVEQKLAACVNIIPNLTSIYTWEGEIKEDQEVLLIVKAPSQSVPLLKEQVLKLHSYQTPEFIEVPTEFITQDYKNWIFEVCQNQNQKS